MSLTDAQKQAYARAHVSTARLWTVEMRHSAFPATLRMVQYTEDITVTLEATAPEDANDPVLFSGLAFRFTEPDLDTEPDSTVQIEIDGVPGFVQPYVVAANLTDEPIEATLREIAYDVYSGEVLELLDIFHLQVRHIRDTKTTVTATLGYTNSANQPFPNQVYTPESNPGLQ